MPVLAHDFFAVLPGNAYPETIPAGSAIDGELAEIAGSLGLLEGSAPATDFAAAVQVVFAANDEIQAVVQETAKRPRKAATRAPEVKA